MSEKKGSFGWFVSLGVVIEMLVAGIGLAQVRSYTPGEYPAPKNPQFKADAAVAVEDLLPVARVLVRKPAGREPLEPGYGIKSGQRALIVVPLSFDDRVLRAITQAIGEAGGRVDVVKTWSTPRGEPTGPDFNLGYGEVRLASEGSGFGGGGTAFDRLALVKQGKYDLLISGSGGPIPVTEHGWEYIPWDTADKFLFSQAGFPHELQKAIDGKMWSLLTSASKVHVTDPEGTDLTWNWKPQFVSMLREKWPGYGTVLEGHVSLFPLFLSPAEAEANGVIGGTTNHTGAFPYILLTIARNEIVGVKGGGEYGKRWAQKVEVCRAAKFQIAGFPGPGCGWLIESATGTDVWRARALNYFAAASWERGRAGVIHFGLGTAAPGVAGGTGGSGPGTSREGFPPQENQPIMGGHHHVHTLFNTIDLTIDGRQVRVADKGRLTLLDDPQIRQIAAKHGNPDELLEYKWIPAIPGINAPGDYMKDYGQDPGKVIAAQQAELQKKIQAASSGR